MSEPRIVLLVGGVGGAKLAVGLAAHLPPEALTIVVNTGDDFIHWGLHVSPDLDTVLYNLAGLANPQMGWGLAGDTREALGMMTHYGGPDWFGLGDRDLATSLVRTDGLRQGRLLTLVMEKLRTALGVAHPVLPMTDEPVRTLLDTDQGWLGFQEYFVRERWQPVVKAIQFKGIQDSRPSAQVAAALEGATAVILGPSNPFLSIDPILSVPGIRERIIHSGVPCIAVSPIIGGKAVKGPAAKLMAELGQDVSSFGVARYYEDILNGIILDEVDEAHCSSIEALGIRTSTRQILMDTPADKTRLGRDVLEWVQELTS